VLGVQLKTQTQLYFFLLFFAPLVTVGIMNLVRSRSGRTFVAIRDQDVAAEIIGIVIFPVQAAEFRRSIVLCWRNRRALYLLSRRRQLRVVPNQRVDRLPVR